MIQLESRLEGTEHVLFDLETALKPMGFVIGDNWQYDHGYFDYKINETDGYLFLRLPFIAIEGTLDTNGVVVRFKSPFLLNHKYEAGLDDDVAMGVMSGFINQFQEPVDQDDYIPDGYSTVGQQIVREAEDAVFGKAAGV